MKKILFLVLIIVSLGVAGCSCNRENEKSCKMLSEEAYVVIDGRGKEIFLGKKPQRIVCDNVFACEILMDMVAHERIAGMTKWVHDPDLSSASEDADGVGKIVENNLESVIALHPDIYITGHGSKPEFVKSIEDVGINVYVLEDAVRLKDISTSIVSLGKLTGEDEKAKKLVSEMNNKLKKIAERVATVAESERPSALLFLRFGAIGGEGCIYNDVLTAAGIKDCYYQAREKEESGSGRILSKEEVVKANPDCFLISTWSQGGAYKSGEEQLEEIYSDPAYANVNAVKKRRAIIIRQNMVNCLSNRVADGIEKLHRIVYEKTGRYK